MVASRCTTRAIGWPTLLTRIGQESTSLGFGSHLSGSLASWRSFMSFSIARIIRNALFPKHELSCGRALWRRLILSLRDRGDSESRESGAFLLGVRDGQRARIVDFVLYDDLDPNCLNSGIVMFDGRHFSKLWSLCKEKGLEVVADIHVHPGSESQSGSDISNPMISCAGHFSIILPRFARTPLPKRGMGFYRYLGDKRWVTIPSDKRARFFHIGI